MKKICTMLINPQSSNYNVNTIKQCKAIIEEKGLKTKLMLCKKDNFIDNFYKDAMTANKESDLVITYGGDGFFGLYQNIINQEGQNTITSHVPIGTANDMALNLGVPTQAIQATQEILNGEITNRDIITSNDIAFGYVSTFGPITNVPYDTPKTIKKLGTSGYLITAMPEILKLATHKFKTYQIKITTPEKSYNTECLIGIISNAQCFSGAKLYPNVNQEDGKFEALFIKPEIIKKIPLLLKEFSKALIGKKETEIDILKILKKEIEFLQTNSLQINFKQVPEKHFDNDGDKGPKLKPGQSIYYQTKGKCKLLLPKKSYSNIE